MIPRVATPAAISVFLSLPLRASDTPTHIRPMTIAIIDAKWCRNSLVFKKNIASKAVNTTTDDLSICDTLGAIKGLEIFLNTCSTKSRQLGMANRRIGFILHLFYCCNSYYSVLLTDWSKLIDGIAFSRLASYDESTSMVSSIIIKLLLTRGIFLASSFI